MFSNFTGGSQQQPSDVVPPNSPKEHFEGILESYHNLLRNGFGLGDVYASKKQLPTIFNTKKRREGFERESILRARICKLVDEEKRREREKLAAATKANTSNKEESKIDSKKSGEEEEEEDEFSIGHSASQIKKYRDQKLSSTAFRQTDVIVGHGLKNDASMGQLNDVKSLPWEPSMLRPITFQWDPEWCHAKTAKQTPMQGQSTKYTWKGYGDEKGEPSPSSATRQFPNFHSPPEKDRYGHEWFLYFFPLAEWGIEKVPSKAVSGLGGLNMGALGHHAEDLFCRSACFLGVPHHNDLSFNWRKTASFEFVTYARLPTEARDGWSPDKDQFWTRVEGIRLDALLNGKTLRRENAREDAKRMQKNMNKARAGVTNGMNEHKQNYLEEDGFMAAGGVETVDGTRTNFDNMMDGVNMDQKISNGGGGPLESNESESGQQQQGNNVLLKAASSGEEAETNELYKLLPSLCVDILTDEKTGDIWVPIAFHGGTNSFSSESTDTGQREAFDLRTLKPTGNTELRFEVFVRCNPDANRYAFNPRLSKKKLGVVGLENQGATCYLNSLLQSQFHLNAFRRAVYDMPTEGSAADSIPTSLQRLFYELQVSRMACSTKELTKSFGWNSLQAFQQHDVSELNRILCDRLEERMKGTTEESTIPDLFTGEFETYLTCVNVDYESSRKEKFMQLNLQVRGIKGLAESFREYIKPERLDGDNKYMTEGYGKQDADKGVRFIKFPPVLHLALQRFTFDFQTLSTIKINSRYEFQGRIDLEEFLDPKARTHCGDNVYILHSVLVHHGNAHGGHYFAYVRQSADSDYTKGWFCFNDESVTKADSEWAIDDMFGGTQAAKNDFQKRKNTKVVKDARMQLKRVLKEGWSHGTVDEKDTSGHDDDAKNKNQMIGEKRKRLGQIGATAAAAGLPMGGLVTHDEVTLPNDPNGLGDLLGGRGTSLLGQHNNWQNKQPNSNLNAYMLVYIKEKELPRLMKQFGEGESDIPEHLLDRFKEEVRKKAEVERKRQLEKLFCKVRVVRTKDVTDWNKLHSRHFDLFNPQVGEEFKMRKKDTILDLHRKLEKKWGIPLEEQRLWRLQCRRTDNLRLYRPYVDKTPIPKDANKGNDPGAAAAAGGGNKKDGADEMERDIAHRRRQGRLPDGHVLKDLDRVMVHDMNAQKTGLWNFQGFNGKVLFLETKEEVKSAEELRKLSVSLATKPGTTDGADGIKGDDESSSTSTSNMISIEESAGTQQQNGKTNESLRRLSLDDAENNPNTAMAAATTAVSTKKPGLTRSSSGGSEDDIDMKRLSSRLPQMTVDKTGKVDLFPMFVFEMIADPGSEGSLPTLPEQGMVSTGRRWESYRDRRGIKVGFEFRGCFLFHKSKTGKELRELSHLMTKYGLQQEMRARQKAIADLQGKQNLGNEESEKLVNLMKMQHWDSQRQFAYTSYEKQGQDIVLRQNLDDSEFRLHELRYTPTFIGTCDPDRCNSGKCVEIPPNNMQVPETMAGDIWVACRNAALYKPENNNNNNSAVTHHAQQHGKDIPPKAPTPSSAVNGPSGLIAQLNASISRERLGKWRFNSPVVLNAYMTAITSKRKLLVKRCEPKDFHQAMMNQKDVVDKKSEMRLANPQASEGSMYPIKIPLVEDAVSEEEQQKQQEAEVVQKQQGMEDGTTTETEKNAQSPKKKPVDLMTKRFGPEFFILDQLTEKSTVRDVKEQMARASNGLVPMDRIQLYLYKPSTYSTCGGVINENDKVLNRFVDWPDCCQNSSHPYVHTGTVGYHNYSTFDERNRFAGVLTYCPEVNSPESTKLSERMRRVMWLRNETFMGYIPYRITSRDSHFNNRSSKAIADAKASSVNMETEMSTGGATSTTGSDNTEDNGTTAKSLWVKHMGNLLALRSQTVDNKAPVMFTIHEYLRVCRTLFPDCCPVVTPVRSELLMRTAAKNAATHNSMIVVESKEAREKEETELREVMNILGVGKFRSIWLPRGMSSNTAPDATFFQISDLLKFTCFCENIYTKDSLSQEVIDYLDSMVHVRSLFVLGTALDKVIYPHHFCRQMMTRVKNHRKRAKIYGTDSGWRVAFVPPFEIPYWSRLRNACIAYNSLSQHFDPTGVAECGMSDEEKQQAVNDFNENPVMEVVVNYVALNSLTKLILKNPKTGEDIPISGKETNIKMSDLQHVEEPFIMTLPHDMKTADFLAHLKTRLEDSDDVFGSRVILGFVDAERLGISVKTNGENSDGSLSPGSTKNMDIEERGGGGETKDNAEEEDLYIPVDVNRIEYNGLYAAGASLSNIMHWDPIHKDDITAPLNQDIPKETGNNFDHMYDGTLSNFTQGGIAQSAWNTVGGVLGVKEDEGPQFNNVSSRINIYVEFLGKRSKISSIGTRYRTSAFGREQGVMIKKEENEKDGGDK